MEEYLIVRIKAAFGQAADAVGFDYTMLKVSEAVERSLIKYGRDWLLSCGPGGIALRITQEFVGDRKVSGVGLLQLRVHDRINVLCPEISIRSN
jgi:hypothetical protein